MIPQWLTLFFAIELGIMPFGLDVESRFPDTSLTKIAFSEPMYLDVDFELEAFDCFNVQGGIKTAMGKQFGEMTFYPFQAEYRIGVSFELGPLTLGARHLCSHPVIPNGYAILPTLVTDRGYEEFYVRLEFEK